MSKINKKVARVAPAPVFTHEGGVATPAPHAAADLRRAVMATMLWEDSFYESGVSIADRIKALVPLCDPAYVAEFAVRAREDMKLRHVPLLLVREMARNPSHRPLVRATLARIIQRADELGEFLAIYWQDGKCPLAAQVKRGLADAFAKFSEYDLAKYDRDGKVKLRDVLFMAHAKPDPAVKRKYTKVERRAEVRVRLTERERVFRALVDRRLEAPDTWEVVHSKLGEVVSALPDAEQKAAKREEWLRLLRDRKLGALALLRNLRNMQEVGVPLGVLREALRVLNVERVLPFRFIAAARYAPELEPELEACMVTAVRALPKLKGRTLVLVDVSGSMDDKLSQKSEVRRLDAACGVAMLAREVCEDVGFATFSDNVVAVPPRRGFALRDAIVHSQRHLGTYLAGALQKLAGNTYDRIIVITDEQSHDGSIPPRAGSKGYMINVASNVHGVGYGTWNKIDGFSEAVLTYIGEYEAWQANNA